MNIQRSIEALGCSKVNKKVIGDMQSNQKVDKTPLEIKIITMWRHFNEKKVIPHNSPAVFKCEARVQFLIFFKNSKSITLRID